MGWQAKKMNLLHKFQDSFEYTKPMAEETIARFQLGFCCTFLTFFMATENHMKYWGRIWEQVVIPFHIGCGFWFSKRKIEDLQPLLYVLLFLSQATLVYISVH